MCTYICSGNRWNCQPYYFFGASVLIPSNQPKAIPVLRILAPTIFFSGFLGVFRGYFQAHRTMIPTSLSQIVEQVANAVISIGAAVFFIHAFAGGMPIRFQYLVRWEVPQVLGQVL